MQEFNIRKKITSHFNRFKFLQDCLAEQVLPKSAPVALKNSYKPFSETANAYLKDACNDLKDSIHVLSDERKGTKLTREHEQTVKKLDVVQRNNLKCNTLFKKYPTFCNISKSRNPVGFKLYRYLEVTLPDLHAKLHLPAIT